MRLKHWAGYGTINARKIYKRTTKDGKTILKITVAGNHERGLMRRDIYDLKRWLIDRFDRTVKDIGPYTIEYTFDVGYIKDAATGCDVETMTYTFIY